MHVLYYNFSHPINFERYPDVCAVPESITAKAVLPPHWSPPDEIIHFKVGKFSQRLIFFKEIEKEKCIWDPLEQGHLEKFYAHCK
jgi:hypothetical protein